MTHAAAPPFRTQRIPENRPGHRKDWSMCRTASRSRFSHRLSRPGRRKVRSANRSARLRHSRNRTCPTQGRPQCLRSQRKNWCPKRRTSLTRPMVPKRARRQRQQNCSKQRKDGPERQKRQRIPACSTWRSRPNRLRQKSKRAEPV